MHLDPSTLRRAFERAGVVDRDGNTIRVREPCGPALALRRAVRRNRAVLDGSLAWREVGTRDTDGALIFALAQADRALDKQSYEETTLASVSVIDNLKVPDGGVLKFGGHALNADVVQAARDALVQTYDRERGVLGAVELRNILAMHMTEDLGGCIVRPGPVLFMPPASEAAIGRMRTALADVDVDVVQFVLDDPKEAKQLAPAATSSLLDDVSTLRAQIENLRAKENTRAETFSNRLAAIEEIKARARLYQELIGVVAADVEAATEACETAIHEAVQEAIAVKPAK